MLRFGLFGVAGHNRGDDAIALSVIAGLRRTFADCEILLAVLKGGTLGPAPADRRLTIDRRSPRGLWAMARAIAQVDVVLLGGGSLIQDRLGGSRIKGVLGYAWTVTLFARLLGKPVYTVPIGVDELRTSLGRKVAREVLRRPRWLALRDETSRAGLAGIAPVPAAVFCDPVFDWEPALPAAIAGDYVALSPAFEGVDDDLLVEIFAGIATVLVERDPARQVVFVAMDSRDEEDAGKIGRIRARVGEDVARAIVLRVPATAEEAAAILRGARAVIAMRLHAVILAYGHTRCFCLSRTTKTAALMREREVDGLDYAQMPIGGVVARAVASVDDDSRLAVHRRRRVQLGTTLDAYYGELKRRIETDGLVAKTRYRRVPRDDRRDGSGDLGTLQPSHRRPQALGSAELTRDGADDRRHQHQDPVR